MISNSSANRRRATPPRIAVIGCGAIARSFHLPALARHPDLLGHLTLVDPMVARAVDLAKEFHAGRVASDYREVLSDVDGAIVLTPPQMHAEIALECIEAGVPVLVEKPLAGTSWQAEMLVNSVARTGVPIAVNNTRRLIPACGAVAELIDSGRLGKVLEIDWSEGDRFDWPSATGAMFGSRGSGRGVVLDVGSHVLDLVCWWLGGKPRLQAYEDDAMGGSEAVARIALGRGPCRISIHLSSLSKLRNSFRIRGERGTIEGGIYDWNSFSVTDASGRKRTVAARPRIASYNALANPLIDNFREVVAGAASPLIPARAVLPSLELLEECYTNRRRFDMPWHDAFDHHDTPTATHA